MMEFPVLKKNKMVSESMKHLSVLESTIVLLCQGWLEAHVQLLRLWLGGKITTACLIALLTAD